MLLNPYNKNILLSEYNRSKILTIQGLRVAFLGTKYFAAYHLYTLLHCSTHNVIAVFTQEKNIVDQKSQWSILKIATAYKLNIFLSQHLLIKDIIHILIKLKIDIIIVVSYGLILPQDILTIPKFGCINVHGSLLPRWRGASPIQRSIEYGDSITGISIIEMNVGIDTGNILYTKICKISPIDNSYTLSKKLAQIGTIGLLITLTKITLGTYEKKPQNLLNITYAKKIKKAEAQINWNLSAIELERRIRAFNPWPVSYFYINQIRIKIWIAKINHENIKEINISKFYPGTILKVNKSGIHVITGSGILILTTLQIPGKKPTLAKNLLHTYKKWFTPNSILK